MVKINSRLQVPFEPLKALCERFAVKELALFGSAIGKDFTETSDVDILVEFKPEAEIGFIELAKMQRELSALLQRSVDLVPKKGLKEKIRDSVISSAETLYAA